MKHYEFSDQWSLVSNESYLMGQKSLLKDQVAESGRHHRGIEYPNQSPPNVPCSNVYLRMLPKTIKKKKVRRLTT